FAMMHNKKMKINKHLPTTSPRLELNTNKEDVKRNRDGQFFMWDKQEILNTLETNMHGIKVDTSINLETQRMLLDKLRTKNTLHNVAGVTGRYKRTKNTLLNVDVWNVDGDLSRGGIFDQSTIVHEFLDSEFMR
ncbi:hypothetical protein ACJX0J_040134, partial [Zea mays]